MIQIDIHQKANKILSDFLKIKGKFTNPLFVCDQSTKHTLIRIHDENHNYFYYQDLKCKTFLGFSIVTDNEVDGLFVMENPYSE